MNIKDVNYLLKKTLFQAWTQYFYMATWIWTLCYAIDIRIALKEKPSNELYYHLAAWIIPAILTTIGLSLLYFPEAEYDYIHTQLVHLNCFFHFQLSHFAFTYQSID